MLYYLINFRPFKEDFTHYSTINAELLMLLCLVLLYGFVNENSWSQLIGWAIIGFTILSLLLSWIFMFRQHYKTWKEAKEEKIAKKRRKEKKRLNDKAKINFDICIPQKLPSPQNRTGREAKTETAFAEDMHNIDRLDCLDAKYQFNNDGKRVSFNKLELPKIEMIYQTTRSSQTQVKNDVTFRNQNNIVVSGEQAHPEIQKTEEVKKVYSQPPNNKGCFSPEMLVKGLQNAKLDKIAKKSNNFH